MQQFSQIFSFPENLDAHKASALLNAAADVMNSPNTGTQAMGAQFEDIIVEGRAMSGLKNTRTLCYDFGVALLRHMASRLPSDVASVAGREFAKRALRATTSFNISSGVVLAGGTSGVISLQLGGTSRFILVDMACSRYVADYFNLKSFAIGSSVLVTQSTISPASPYQGLTMAVYDATGPSYNDVMPEFGVEWAGAVGSTLTVSAEFLHVRPSDDPAIATLSLLCLVDTCSGQDVYRRAANLASSYGGLPRINVMPSPIL